MNCKQLYQIVNNLPRYNKTVRTHNLNKKLVCIRKWD